MFEIENLGAGLRLNQRALTRPDMLLFGDHLGERFVQQFTDNAVAGWYRLW